MSTFALPPDDDDAAPAKVTVDPLPDRTELLDPVREGSGGKEAAVSRAGRAGRPGRGGGGGVGCADEGRGGNGTGAVAVAAPSPTCGASTGPDVRACGGEAIADTDGCRCRSETSSAATDAAAGAKVSSGWAAWNR